MYDNTLRIASLKVMYSASVTINVIYFSSYWTTTPEIPRTQLLTLYVNWHFLQYWHPLDPTHQRNWHQRNIHCDFIFQIYI